MIAGRRRRALFAGFCGGLLAGLIDAGFALSGAPGLLGWQASLHVVVIDGGLGAIAGAALGMTFIGWTLAFERVLGTSRWLSGSHAVALLLASPILIYDAFAVFSGAQASRIPGHRALSALLIVLGAAAFWSAVTLWRELLWRGESASEARSERRGRVAIRGVGLLSLLLALGLAWANHHVLPRLYHWFHLTLALAGLVCCILAVRLLVGDSSMLRKRWYGIMAAVVTVAVVVGVALERPVFLRSQSLRFFVHEKTELASIFARLLRGRPPRVAPATGSAVMPPREPPLPDGPHRPNADIVLITVDAVRADHVGCYGYGRPTTPQLDALAAQGVRFERAYTQAPHTSFALASLMIGKYYPTLARIASSDAHETLAAILRRYGWKTAAFFPPAVFYIDAHKMKAFESSNFDFEYVKYEYLDADQRVGQIRDFLAAEQPKKLFLWLHLFEPHEPYERHADFDFGPRDVDRYDGEIAYSDMVVGKVVALIRQQRPGAVVVVAADHGEEFGEHGGRYHGTTLYEEQIRVPLVVSVPGLAPRVVSGPVELIDVSATILGLLDIPLPLRMRGTDLGPWLGQPPAPEQSLPAAFAEVEDKRMIAIGTEKLICDTSKDFCSFFDLATDPGERRDLVDERAARVADLRGKLDAWLAQQARYEARLVGAAAGGGELAAAIARARLGDATAATALARQLLGGGALVARREAASLLASALPPRAETRAELLAAVERSDDPELRAWAAVAALRGGATELTEQVRALVGEAAARGAWQIHAALVLGGHGDAAGVRVLTESLETCGGDVALCKRMLGVLGALRDPAAVGPLLSHLDFVQTRRETVEALGTLGDAAAVGALLGALASDAYVPVRAAAAEALARIGGVRAVQGLEVALRREREDAVKSAIREALAKLGRRR